MQEDEFSRENLLRLQPRRAPLQPGGYLAVHAAALSLEQELRDRLLEVQRTDQDRDIVDACVALLRELLSQIGPDWYCEPFGSAVNGFGTTESDLDVTCYEASNSDNVHHAANAARSWLSLVLRSYIESHERFEVVQLICGARVPILKLKFKHGLGPDLEVDLSCHNKLPLSNTHLLRAYADLDHVVRDLCVAVKLWAKAAGVCEARMNNLSPYAFNLLTIYFLQVDTQLQFPCVPVEAFRLRSRQPGQEEAAAGDEVVAETADESAETQEEHLKDLLKPPGTWKVEDVDAVARADEIVTIAPDGDAKQASIAAVSQEKAEFDKLDGSEIFQAGVVKDRQNEAVKVTGGPAQMAPSESVWAPKERRAEGTSMNGDVPLEVARAKAASEPGEEDLVSLHDESDGEPAVAESVPAEPLGIEAELPGSVGDSVEELSDDEIEELSDVSSVGYAATWRSPYPVTELLIRFFRFYAHDFRWGTEVASIRTGKRLGRNDQEYRKLRGRWTIRLHIEDPYVRERNLHCVLGEREEPNLIRAIMTASMGLQPMTMGKEGKESSLPIGLHRGGLCLPSAPSRMVTPTGTPSLGPSVMSSPGADMDALTLSDGSPGPRGRAQHDAGASPHRGPQDVPLPPPPVDRYGRVSRTSRRDPGWEYTAYDKGERRYRDRDRDRDRDRQRGSQDSGEGHVHGYKWDRGYASYGSSCSYSGYDGPTRHQDRHDDYGNRHHYYDRNGGYDHERRDRDRRDHGDRRDYSDGRDCGDRKELPERRDCSDRRRERDWSGRSGDAPAALSAITVPPPPPPPAAPAEVSKVENEAAAIPATGRRRGKMGPRSQGAAESAPPPPPPLSSGAECDRR